MSKYNTSNATKAHQRLSNLLKERHRDFLSEDFELKDDRIRLKNTLETAPTQSFKQDTIKSLSRFNSFFDQIYQPIKTQIDQQQKVDNSSNDDNKLYLESFVVFLIHHYMPYTPLWSGLVLRGLYLTRITNGSLERLIGFRKKKTRYFNFAQYVYKMYPRLKGSIKDFISKDKENDFSLADIEVENIPDSDDSNVSAQSDNDVAEEQYHKAKETWAKDLKGESQLKKINYQAKQGLPSLSSKISDKNGKC